MTVIIVHEKTVISKIDGDELPTRDFQAFAKVATDTGFETVYSKTVYSKEASVSKTSG